MKDMLEIAEQEFKAAFFDIRWRLGAIRRLLRRRHVASSGCWEWTGLLDRDGYGRVRAAGRQVQVHRLSAVLFLDLGFDSPLFALHHCDNRWCFNPEHLYIGTAADNARDCVIRKRTRSSRGSKHGQAKLTEAAVADIMRALKGGTRPIDLARRFGVSDSTIGLIKSGKTWRHLSAQTSAHEAAPRG